MSFFLFPGIIFFFCTIIGVGFYYRSKGWDEGYKQSSDDSTDGRHEVDELLGRDWHNGK